MHPLTNANVLITGGMGFIGSNLALRLVNDGAAVTLVDSMVPEYGGNMANLEGFRQRVHLNFSDIRDEHSLRHLVQGKDVIFNLAGQTSHMDSMSDPLTDLEINCKAQLSLLEVCREVNPRVKIVFASTRQIYGKPIGLPVDETHPVAPVDVNGINKAAGDWYHLLYHNTYDMRTCCLRLTNTYGPRMRIKDARQTFLGIWIRLVLEGKGFEVWGGEQLRDFTYVDDCVEALLLAATTERSNGQVYNIGGERAYTLSEVAEKLVARAGRGFCSRKEFPAERKRIDIGDYYADDRKIRSELGWSTMTDLDHGLAASLDYFAPRLKDYL